MQIKLTPRRKTLYFILLPLALLGIGVAVFVWINVMTPHPKPVMISDVSTVLPGIQYCNSKNPSLSLNLYYPKGEVTSKLPLVVYIHGGGWFRGDESGPLLEVYGTRFIKKGIAVASIDYRLDTKSPFPDQNNDVACALDYLNTNAERLHLDEKKVLYFGDSAGGQLAAFAALNVPFNEYDYEAPVGVIDFYGVSHFSTIVNGAHPDLNARRYLGSKYNSVADLASPTTYVTKHAPRFIFFHGTKDTVVPISQSKTLYDLLIAAGVDSEYVAIDGARHAFIGPELSAAQYKKIQDSLDTFLLETINR
jgi:acetyl esterase/lipase